MVKTKEIKAQLKRKGITQAELAHKINMNPSTLNRKINNDEGEVLTVKEANNMSKVLEIERCNLVDIFFATELTETQVLIGKENMECRK